MGMRIGTGADAHRFGPGRPLMLGTVNVPHDEGLVGHSDGDVVAHALCDALLAAAGEPDIGVVFPSGDPAWEGASGARLLAVVMERVRGAGMAVVNAHAVAVCERPRLAPHRGAMEAALSELVGAPVGVHATTTDGMGALGRGEGVACHAVALLETGVSGGAENGDGPRLHSTLSKRREPLEPGPEGVVRIYVCGPTVYGPIHIGNARPYVVFSVLKRYLERRGMRVKLVSNLTDVNDKIYDAAHAEGVPSDELARRYSARYVADTDRLGLGRPDAEPTVTETMPRIIELIGTLVDAGLAYPSGGDVYYRVGRFPGYGRLSGRRPDELEPQEPGPGKESPLDFALWKGRKPEEDTWWDSPWGPGRPGWHIECSAMSEATLGLGFEIHGGGIDLIFPHHENEIAQSEGAHGGHMADIWMHNEMLELGDEKMSKSLGNIAPLSDVLDRWPAEVVIAFFLTSHYRSRLPFSEERMEEAAAVVERLRNALVALDRATAGRGEGTDPALTAAVIESRAAFFDALDDDFGTPAAFAALFDLVRAANRAIAGREAGAGQLRDARRELLELLDVLGLASIDPGPAAAVPDEVMELLGRREDARTARDFAAADAARDRVRELGFEITDTPEGPQVRPA